MDQQESSSGMMLGMIIGGGVMLLLVVVGIFGVGFYHFMAVEPAKPPPPARIASNCRWSPLPSS